MWKIAEVFEGSIFPARLWSKKEGKQVTAHASSGCSKEKEKHKITENDQTVWRERILKTFRLYYFFIVVL